MNSHKPGLASHPYRAHLWLAAGVALLLTGVFGWIVAVDAWPGLRGPGPWPPSWRWLHQPLDFWAGGKGLVHLLLLGAYGGAVAGLQWERSGGGTRVRLGLALAVLFMFVWQLAQVWVREQSLLDTLIFRTYAPPLNGYFLAPAQAEDVAWTLRNYAQAMPHFFGDKPETHPPGLFLFYLAFQRLFEALPSVSGWLGPIVRGWAIPGRDWPQLGEALLSSAFVTSWLQIGLTSLAPLTVYLALGQFRGGVWGGGVWGGGADARRGWALFVALLLPLIPPLTLFVLQWDTVYPALGFLAWFLALRGQNRGDGWWDWLGAGLLLSLLTWLSFGNLVYGLLIGLHVLWRAGLDFSASGERLQLARFWPLAAGLGLMGLGVALPWLLAYLGWEMNFFALMDVALSRHYQIVTAQRVYTVWVWMNLVDFALWLGPGMLLLGIVGSVGSLRRAREVAAVRDVAGLGLIFWAVLLLLNFSGSTRGEIGRLWMFLMPFPVLLAAALPWGRAQRLCLLLVMLAWSWVIAYSIPPFLCC